MATSKNGRTKAHWLTTDTDGVNPSVQIRALRSVLGLTQEQMAHELGVSFATVNRWETGKRAPSPVSQGRLEALEGRAEALVVAAADHGLRSQGLLVPPTPLPSTAPPQLLSLAFAICSTGCPWPLNWPRPG